MHDSLCLQLISNVQKQTAVADWEGAPVKVHLQHSQVDWKPQRIPNGAHQSFACLLRQQSQQQSKSQTRPVSPFCNL